MREISPTIEKYFGMEDGLLILYHVSSKMQITFREAISAASKDKQEADNLLAKIDFDLHQSANDFKVREKVERVMKKYE